MLWDIDPWSGKYIVAEVFIQEDFLQASIKKRYFFGEDVERYRVTRHPVSCVPSIMMDVSEFDTENWGKVLLIHMLKDAGVKTSVFISWGCVA